MDWSKTLFVSVIGLGLFFTGRPQTTESTEDAFDAQLSNIKKLKDKLFTDQKYDEHVRPVLHHSNTTVVDITIYPFYVVDLNEDRSLFILDSWMGLHWTDYRLSWNPDDYDGLSNISLPDSFVWQPDIYVFNSRSWNMNPKSSTHLLLYHEGDVWSFPAAMITTYCSTEPVAGSYPIETVECEVRMGSWTHDGSQIDLQLLHDEIDLHEFINSNPRWEMLVDQVNISRQVNHFNCCQEPYITVVAKFPLQRRYPPELEVIRPPCVMVMIITLATFWIPTNSGKVFLSSLLSLVLVVLTAYAASASRSPRFPLSAVSFLSSTMYVTVSAAVLEIVVVYISSLAGPSRPPRFLMNLFSGRILKTVVVYSRYLDRTAGNTTQLDECTDRVDISSRTAKEEWMLIGCALDRFLFIVYVIIVASLYKS